MHKLYCVPVILWRRLNFVRLQKNKAHFNTLTVEVPHWKALCVRRRVASKSGSKNCLSVTRRLSHPLHVSPWRETLFCVPSGGRRFELSDESAREVGTVQVRHGASWRLLTPPAFCHYVPLLLLFSAPSFRFLSSSKRVRGTWRWPSCVSSAASCLFSFSDTL